MHSGNDPARVVNETGQYVYSMHPWKFMERPAVPLDLRADIAFTAALWTESALTLAITAPALALANYTFLAGDRYQVTGGTGAKQSTFGIASIASNTITSKETISSTAGSANGVATIAGSVIPSSALALPSDFGTLLDVSATDGLVNAVTMTDHGTLNEMRTNGVELGAWSYFAAIAYGAASAPGGSPVPRLEIYPNPSANDANGFTLFYRAGWSNIVAEGSAGTTEQIIPIPEWMEFQFRQLCMAIAHGYEEKDEQPMAAWMAPALALFEPLKARDGLVQPSYGHTRGGVIARHYGMRPEGFLRSTVANPA